MAGVCDCAGRQRPSKRPPQTPPTAGVADRQVANFHTHGRRHAKLRHFLYSPLAYLFETISETRAPRAARKTALEPSRRVDKK